jgi:hypothetical protein
VRVHGGLAHRVRVELGAGDQHLRVDTGGDERPRHVEGVEEPGALVPDVVGRDVRRAQLVLDVDPDPGEGVVGRQRGGDDAVEIAGAEVRGRQRGPARLDREVRGVHLAVHPVSALDAGPLGDAGRVGVERRRQVGVRHHACGQEVTEPGDECLR